MGGVKDSSLTKSRQTTSLPISLETKLWEPGDQGNVLGFSELEGLSS